MSTHMGLFYAKMLRNCIHFVHIYIFLCCCLSREFFGTSTILHKMIFKQIYLTIDRTLTGTNTQGQSGLGSNGNEGILHTPLTARIEASSLNDILRPRLC